MVLQFVMPFIVIGFCYVYIWTYLNHRRATSMTANRQMSDGEITRRRRLLKMLISMVVIFALCWFPFNALNILRDFQLDENIRHIFSFLYLVAHLISMSATCWNPILYAYMNENFRREFKAALPCFHAEPATVLPRADSQVRNSISHSPHNGGTSPINHNRRTSGTQQGNSFCTNTLTSSPQPPIITNSNNNGQLSIDCRRREHPNPKEHGDQTEALLCPALDDGQTAKDYRLVETDF